MDAVASTTPIPPLASSSRNAKARTSQKTWWSLKLLDKGVIASTTLILKSGCTLKVRGQFHLETLRPWLPLNIRDGGCRANDA